MRAFPLAALLAIGFLQLAAPSCRSSEPLEIEVPGPRRLELPLVNGEALHIRGLSGTILIRVDPDSPPYAEIRPASHGLALGRIGSALVLRVGEGCPPLALELSLPKDIALLCESSTGLLEATGPLRSAHIRGHRGPIHLRGIAGDLLISSLTGDITVEGATGGCSIETQAGAIQLSDISGRAVAARSRGGDVRLRGVRAETVEAYTSRGTLDLRDIEGTLTARAERGTVSVSESAGPALSFNTDEGDIHLDGVRGVLRVETRIGAIDALHLTGSIDARTKEGDISLEGVFEGVLVHSLTGTIEVRAEDESQAQSPWSLESRFGGISLRLPRSFACNFDLTAERGEVQTKLDLTPSSGHEQVSLDGGGSTVRLVSGEGNITILRTDP